MVDYSHLNDCYFWREFNQPIFGIINDARKVTWLGGKSKIYNHWNTMLNFMRSVLPVGN